MTLAKEMKLITSVILSLVLTVTTGMAKEPRVYSAAWLKQGCIYIIAYSNNASNLDAGQKNTMTQVATWLNGNLSGVVVGVSIGDNVKEKVPDGWNEPTRAAPQILAFMENHKERIDPDSFAAGVAWAWVLTVYPGTTQFQRTNALKALEIYNNAGMPE